MHGAQTGTERSQNIIISGAREKKSSPSSEAGNLSEEAPRAHADRTKPANSNSHTFYTSRNTLHKLKERKKDHDNLGA
jgi:hypothetical protein